MGQKFDDYPGFQQIPGNAYTFATECIWTEIMISFMCLDINVKLLDVKSYFFHRTETQCCLACCIMRISL